MEQIKVLTSYEEVDGSIQAFILDGMLIAENLGVVYDGTHVSVSKLRPIPENPRCYLVEKEYFDVRVGVNFDVNLIKTMNLSTFLLYATTANDKVEAQDGVAA